MVRALPKDVTKIYLLNQDYLFGQSVQRDVKAKLAKIRPDVQVVGDELIPLGKVKDFAPYITKIKASGAQALLTGNWGPGHEPPDQGPASMPGVDLRYYTMYAHLAGGPTAIGPAGDGKVFAVMSFGENVAPEIGNQGSRSLDGSVPREISLRLLLGRLPHHLRVPAGSHQEGGRGRCDKIAFALEGLQHKDFIGFDSVMRKDDHQLISEYFVRRLQEGREVRFGEDRAGLGHGRDRAGQGLRRADHLQDEAGRPRSSPRVRPPAGSGTMEVFLVSLLNGLVYGMLLFMLASGLTLILSMMGVLNFAHASAYMLGAYFAYTISQHIGFWPALVLAPLLCGLIGGAIEMYGLRRVCIATATSPSCSSPSAWR